METETQPAAANETERGEMETGQHVAESVVLTKETLSVEAAHRFVGCAKAGAVACFVGTTRDSFEGKRVLCLEYEAYEAMAVRKMEEVCRKARGRFPGVLRLYVAHRVGVVAIGEASVVIAVSSPHRVDAISTFFSKLSTFVLSSCGYGSVFLIILFFFVLYDSLQSLHDRRAESDGADMEERKVRRWLDMEREQRV